jgi:glycosyltransferase involved in cell wall biosynthesis
VRKLRILLVVRWPVGGIRTYLKYVYGSLERSRYHVVLIAARTEESTTLLTDLDGLLADYVEIEEGASSTTWTRAVWNQVRGKRFDIVHSHGPTAALLSMPAARLARVRHICTLHETLHARQFAGWKGRVRLLALRTGLPRVDVVQTVGRDATENLLQFIPSLGSPRRAVVPIHNGIRSELFEAPARRDLRGELGIDAGTFLIGFFGRFMSPKGFRYLIDAMAILTQELQPPRRPLVLAFGAGGFVREEQAVIAARGLTESFRFMPFVADMASNLRGVDLVAIPSLWEACPLLPMEAMAAGVPVIGSNCVGLREVLENSPAVVIPAADARALADAILAQIRNPQPQEAAAAAFAAEARKRFDSRTTGRLLEGLLWERFTAEPQQATGRS